MGVEFKLWYGYYVSVVPQEEIMVKVFLFWVQKKNRTEISAVENLCKNVC